MWEYKGYHAEFVFDAEDNYYTGRLYGISDLVMFGGTTEKELKADFYAAVDEYLDYCKEIGKEPKREEIKLSNIEIKDDLYQSLSTVAKNTGESLNELVEKILTGYLAKTA